MLLIIGFILLLMLVLWGEKIVASNIIQYFLSSKSDAKIIFGGLDCLKFNHYVPNQNGIWGNPAQIVGMIFVTYWLLIGICMNGLAV